MLSPNNRDRKIRARKKKAITQQKFFFVFWLLLLLPYRVPLTMCSTILLCNRGTIHTYSYNKIRKLEIGEGERIQPTTQAARTDQPQEARKQEKERDKPTLHTTTNNEQQQYQLVVSQFLNLCLFSLSRVVSFAGLFVVPLLLCLSCSSEEESIKINTLVENQTRSTTRPHDVQDDAVRCLSSQQNVFSLCHDGYFCH